MDRRENQRVMLTRRLVRESLLALLREKTLHKISIRELCERAGINRTTFYNHYGSQYDVLSDMARAYLSDIEETINAADVRDRQSVLQRVTLVLQYIIDNLELSRILLGHVVDASFTERLFSLPKIEEMLDSALQDVPDPQAREAVTAFAIYGSYKILRDWMDREVRRSPQEQAALILTLAGRVCNLR